MGPHQQTGNWPAAPREDSALEGHCRRVAALGCELAGRLRLSSADQEVLRQAAMLHHYPLDLLETGSLHRLLSDVMGPGVGRLPEAPASSLGLSPDVRAVLEAFHRSRPEGSETTPLLAQLLEISNFYVERKEFVPIEGRTERQIVSELVWMANDGLFDRRLVTALEGLQQVRTEDLAEVLYRLPVYPAVALKVLTLPVDGQTRELEAVASSDQVLASVLVRAANSAVYSPIQPISSIRHAITYMGAFEARRLLTAAALQPLFASSRTRELWKHSVEAAEKCERLARLSRRVPPDEAFLAGLVHDVGRLALWKLHGQFVTVYARLLERGCPPVFAETLLCGFDHGEAGAEGLRLWSFPEHLVAAVQYHHQPEQSDSVLASLLYLVEASTESEEDAPSIFRLREASNRLGVSPESLHTLTLNKPETLAVALGA